ncbi:hypothetical protein [Streptomyces sp. NPDC049879]|uniref:hypothetical protein n=1 Tax=Streptomyces sp. NPDC049879 TaxID=3365598 RepID=UPI0037B2026C
MAEDETPGSQEAPVPQKETASEAGGRAGRRRWIVAAGVAVATAAVAGGAYLAVGTAGEAEPGGGLLAEDGTPALLLDGTGAWTAGASEAAPAPDIALMPLELTADGPLPDGPDRATVHRFEADVPEESAAGLAAALGVEGPLRESAGAWTASGPDADGGTLTVQQAAPGGWSYGGGVSAASPDTPVERDLTEQLPSGGVPDEDEAREAVAPLLAALGLADAEDARVDASRTAGDVRLVQVVPLVDGLPVSGMETTAHVAAGGAVVAAYGSLATPVAAEERAAVGAEEALDEWNAALPEDGAAWGIEPCAPVETALPDPEAVPGAETGGGGGEIAVLPCAPEGPEVPGEPLPVTAEFGLALHYSDEEPVLVPSWLFRPADVAAGDPYPAQQPAVAYEYAPVDGNGAGDEADSSDSGNGSDSGDSSDSSPGEAPADPGSGEEAPETGMSVAPYDEGDRTLTLRFWGGVCDEYAGVAEESADGVTLGVEAEGRPTGENCILVAEEQTVEVALDAPVGDRPVLAEDGSELPVR